MEMPHIDESEFIEHCIGSYNNDASSDLIVDNEDGSLKNGAAHDLVVNNEGGSATEVVDDVVETPFEGMVFKTSEDARKHYGKYGVSKGFSILTRSSRKNWARTDMVTSITFVCSHFGKHDKKIDVKVPKDKQRPNTSTMRGECQARLLITLDPNILEWVVQKFIDDHNHPFVSPRKRKFLKINRNFPNVVKNMVEKFSEENLPTNKVHSIFGGDIIGFNRRACWNHLRDVRQKLDVGDVQWVLQHFQKRVLENPRFYHAVQCDGEGRAVNFFWVDARSRMSYQQFGDVVSFVTTYKTNKYSMPFAPFTGVNHHFQTIQFGCALLQDESEDTFTWLFEIWKKEMGEIAPISLITDSDLAMRAAIPKVFPNTRHRLCYWHIKKKFGEKIRHVYYKRSKFKKEMKECLKFTYITEDFERKWQSLMTEYELTSNEWLQGLYKDREAWVPVYNHTTFFAGMNSTGRSEGINSFFKDYINSKTSLMEFVQKYENALKRIENNEREEDFESEQRYRLLTEDSYLLRHAKEIYTRRMFEKFRANWILVEKYKSDVSGHEYDTHMVSYKCGVTDHWIVKLNPKTLEGTCECHFFEFVGIPCAHILKVFSKLDLTKIPEYFIKKRWLMGANKFRVNDKKNSISEGQDNVQRLSQLCQEATQWACVAAQTSEGYKIFLDEIRKLGRKISEIVPSKTSKDTNLSANHTSQVILDPNVAKSKDRDIGAAQVNSPVNQENCVPIDGNVSQADDIDDGDDVAPNNPTTTRPPQVLLNPNISQTKGRKRNAKETSKRKSDARYKHPIELSQEKTKRKCSICKIYMTHDKRNCPKKGLSESGEDVGVEDITSK